TMQREELARGWSRALKGTTAASSAAAGRQRRAAAMVGALLRTLEKSKEHSAAAADIAREHGRQRKDEGRSLTMLLEEFRLLRRIVMDLVQQNLLAVEISLLLPDLSVVNDALDTLLAAAVEGYVDNKRK